MLVKDAKAKINNYDNHLDKNRIVTGFKDKAKNTLDAIVDEELQKQTYKNISYDEVCKLEVEILDQLIEHLEDFKADL